MQRNQHLIILAGLKTVLLFFCLISGSHAGAQQPKLILPTGHQGEMEILFSPDGSRILTNGEEGTAKLWDARSGRMLADLVGHKGKIEEVLFTSDGKKIITNAADNTVKIWNTLSGDMLFTLDANKGKISSVVLMNRGDRAIIEYDSATIFRISTIWDLASGKLLHTIPFSKYRTDNGEIIAVPPQTAFSPDGNFVARTDAFNYSQDSLVVLVTELTGKQRPRQLEGYFTGLGYLQYSPDGKTIRAACFKKYTGSPDTAQKTNDPSGYLEIMLWNAATGKLISKWTAGPWKNYNGRGNMVKQFDGRNVILISKEQQQDQTKAAVQVGDLVTRKLKFTIDLPPNEWKSYFFPDNQTFFLRTNKDSLMIWDLGSGRLLASPGKLTGGDKAYQFGEGNKILAFIQNNTVKIWDRASARLLFSLQHSTGIDSMRLGPLNKTLLTFTKDNTIHLWDLLTGRLLRSIPNGDNELLSAKQSGDGKYLAVITTVYEEEEEEKEEEEEEQEMKTVDLWDLAAGKKLWSFSTQEEDLNYNFSPDSRSIILYKQERSYYRDTKKQGKENIELRDIQTGRLISGFTGNASAIQSAIISPGGDRIAITTEDSTVKLWDIPSGKFLPVWKGHTDRVNSVQYSADGKYVLSASADSTVKLWEAVSGKLLYTFPAAEEPVNTAQFSPDGKYIITATDYDAMIWDAATRQWIRTLEGGGAKDARFSPDGKYIITDGTLWNAATGEEIFYLDWHNGEIISNRFSPDSKYIVTASADETAKVWSTEFGELVFSLDDHADEVVYAAYSEDGRYIITASLDNTIKTWDAPTGRLLQTRYLGPNTVMKDFSVKTNRMVYAEAGTELKIADGLTGEMLYSFYAVGSEDYLVVDKYRRYDGTENARKLLYFTCNDEIIELAQLKDKLWTPNLARRLMNGDSIFAPRLSELNICGLTPQVADKSDGKTGYRFVINPRRGGLGETVLL
ncbi:MAG TPA: WD40 repeat domain-containing protein, partial [Chitinophagaceae bacterium]|nr:WD40 repeat domain-containing protein [Chitinophagaceae bacterium]